MKNTFENSIETPREQIDDRLQNFLQNGLLVALPAKVVSTSNYETQQVIDVTPVLDDILIDGRVLKAPVISSVFVKIPSGGGFSVKLPIAVGDLVTLHYSHKDLSQWLDSDSSTNIAQDKALIADKRDCWATHGFGTRKQNQSPSATDYVTECPNTTITITPEGQVTLDTSSEILIKTSGTTTIDSDLNVTGKITAPEGDFESSLKIDAKELKNHTHGYSDFADYNDDGTPTSIPRTTQGNN